MGIFGDRRSELVVKAAIEAASRGARVFTPVFEWPRGVAGNTFSVDEWADMIAGIEAAGWVLDFWSVTDSEKERRAYPVFRAR